MLQVLLIVTGMKNKTLMMIVTTRVKIKTTLSKDERIYYEGEGEEEEQKEEEEKEKLLVLEKTIIQDKILF
jgi:hypothetical protein